VKEIKVELVKSLGKKSQSKLSQYYQQLPELGIMIIMTISADMIVPFVFFFFFVLLWRFIVSSQQL